MKRTIKHLAIAAASMAVAAQTATAAFTFSNGDIVLAFQGTGDSTNVYFNLGSATALRDGTTTGLLGNISNSLTTAFGAGWATRTDLYFGAIGNLSSAAASGPGSAAAVNGDPSRTFYVSRATTTAGGSSAYSGFTSNALASAATGFNPLESILTSGQSGIGTALTYNADNSASLGNTEANSWTQWNPVSGGNQGTAFNVFSGGIQNTLGAGSQALIDIQRILITNTGASPTQAILGTGVTYSTIAIGDNGNISVIPEPTTGILAGIAVITLAFRRNRKA